jgi:hypothetical protein
VSEIPPGPDYPGGKVEGAETVRSAGDLWIVAEGHNDEMGGHMLTLGYDPKKQRFVGTWFGDRYAYLWVYDGQLDTAERVLTLDCEGPAMTEGGGMARYRDIHELRSDDERVLRAEVQGQDGNWQQFMTQTYRRKR